MAGKHCGTVRRYPINSPSTTSLPTPQSIVDESVGTSIRKHWVPSFDAYHLTAAFENHEHSYKRTVPILNGEIDPKGVMYIGDGGWGVDKPRKPRHVDQKWYLANAISARHFLFVVVEQGKQTVEAINSDGVIIDQFSW